MMYTLSEIYIYPVKSLKGIPVSSAEVTDRGLKYDRRLMIVDGDGNFITQRTHPELALFDTKLNNGKLTLSHRSAGVSPIVVDFDEPGEKINVQVWDDLCAAVTISRDIDEWLSGILGFKAGLVFMPEETRRLVDRKYAAHDEIVSFADAYPFLIIGNESFADMNSRLENQVPMNRFRPNFVFTGGEAYDEDSWGKFKIGNVIFGAVKPCSRCVFTTVDQQTGIRGSEPLKTLSTYRRVNNKVMFGQNLLHENYGTVSVGEKIEVISRKEKPEYD